MVIVVMMMLAAQPFHAASVGGNSRLGGTVFAGNHTSLDQGAQCLQCCIVMVLYFTFIIK